MEQQTTPASQPAPESSSWVQPDVARQGGTTLLAKLGGLILFVWGLLFTLLGGAAIAGGALFKDTLRNLAGQDLDAGQVGDVVGGAIVVVGVVVVVIAIVEMLVGIFSFRGGGFARVLGILYGLFFGLILLAASVGPRDLGTGSASGGVLGLVLAASYLYTAIVFVVAYRSKA
jgi:hypothetical protein